ncbi:HU family DNA-binding protein [Polaribacter sp. R77954]|uniref:HU family DNA-binding protein n=1 Tax=Polaribacter sp. R77954 TaxID=3093870 RepID=UPI0037C904AF
MSIIYKTLPRKNPQDMAAPEKFYAAVVANGSVDFETLAEQISNQCTVTETDCLAVLNALEQNIVYELKQGRIVRLGKLGNFQVSLSSTGLSTADEVSAQAIKATRILFRPAKKMRNLLKNLSFRKASS